MTKYNQFPKHTYYTTTISKEVWNVAERADLEWVYRQIMYARENTNSNKPTEFILKWLKSLK